MQDIRISKIAVYTGRFNLPTELHTQLVNPINNPTCSEVSLSIQSDTTNQEDAFIDISINENVVTKNGDVKHSIDNAFLGNSSCIFDGNGDYLTIPHSDEFTLNDEDFTIECYVYFNNLDTSISTILSKWYGAGGGTLVEKSYISCPR